MKKEKWEEQFDKEFLCDIYSDFDEAITIISPEINGSSLSVYTTIRAEIKKFIEKAIQQERERIIEEIWDKDLVQPAKTMDDKNVFNSVNLVGLLEIIKPNN